MVEQKIPAEKDVPHPQVTSRDSSVEDRVKIYLENPTSVADTFFYLSVKTSLFKLEQRLEESKNVLNEYKEVQNLSIIPQDKKVDISVLRV